MHLSPQVAKAAVRSKAVVLLLLMTFCLMLLPLWESVTVLCFVVRFFVFLLVLQSPWWGRGGGLVALLGLSSWCLVVVERLFLALLWDCLWFVIVVFPDHTHLLVWPCCKMGGGQVRCNICASLLRSTSPMLHSKSQGH